MDLNTRAPVRVIDMRDALKATRIHYTKVFAPFDPFPGVGVNLRLSEWSAKGEIPAEKARVLYLVDEPTAWWVKKALPSRNDFVFCFSQEFKS